MERDPDHDRDNLHLYGIVTVIIVLGQLVEKVALSIPLNSVALELSSRKLLNDCSQEATKCGLSPES